MHKNRKVEVDSERHEKNNIIWCGRNGNVLTAEISLLHVLIKNKQGRGEIWSKGSKYRY